MLIESKTEIIPSQASQELEGVTTISKGLTKKDFLHLGQVSPKQLAVQVLIGTVLGDGSLVRSSKTKATLALYHSYKQVDYEIWKAKALYPLVGSFQYRVKEGEVSDGIRMYTLSSSYLKHMFDDFYSYDGGKWQKVVKLRVLRRLSPMGLMVWYCDDGSLEKHNGRVDGIKLATCSFTEQENDMMCQYFMDNWKLRFSIKKDMLIYNEKVKQYCSLVAYGYSFRDFIELVGPYVPKCMRYKVDPLLSARHDSFNREDIVCTLEQSRELLRNKQPKKSVLKDISIDEIKRIAEYINVRGLSARFATTHIQKTGQLVLSVYDKEDVMLKNIKLYFGGSVIRESNGYGYYYKVSCNRASEFIRLISDYLSLDIITYLADKNVIIGEF